MTDNDDQLICESEFISEEERDAAKTALKKKFGYRHIVGKSSAICEIREKIERVSKFDANVLICGESGTGKELVARALHYLGPRAGKPFIPVNCGAVPDHLFENELFGHVKGAFTDASKAHSGLVTEASGGTLFLDEISTISQNNQVKLLRLLENSEYKPLGAASNRKADIRITAATNQSLVELVKNNAFREDLYYRLNVVRFHIPPLKDRKEDIPPLVEHFVKKYSREFKRSDVYVSANSMKTFVSYPWKGNVRELENRIQSLIIVSKSLDLRIEDPLPPNPEPAVRLENFKVAKENAINTFERNYLIQLLKEFNGDVAKAATGSGKGRTALWNLIKKHNLQPKQFRLPAV